ncbi:hypothetical protein LNQ49_21640 [Flavobacterium sp. F-65]|jgi:hypothetical protein|uniref:Uncharacterized protein n=1 Tax=Flavobacterium pisciphilum TaxID=2893755 RepID=A0ABS8MZJ9_9FLAO|nr:hypothetical protein [Flavobacterium sp. F-65]MCC9074197.1 hypothetical protein [Flavobacterium sp. F-65]
MKRNFLISLIIINSVVTVSAQQWNGTSPIFTTSNVGIGTTLPESQLHVVGDNLSLTISRKTYVSNNSEVGIDFKQLTDNGFYRTGGAIKSISNNSYLGGQGNTYSSQLAFYSVGGGNLIEGLRIDDKGNIGMGIISPAYKLDVCGTIRAKEIKVDLLAGCDFVFEKDYKLMSLNELDKFVKTEKHLPEIQSEKEMIEDGLNLKMFQMKLLQKIEELTLYVIEQNKKNEQQEQELKRLKAKIKKIESRKN